MHLASINSAEEQDNLEDHIQSFGERESVRVVIICSDEYSGLVIIICIFGFVSEFFFHLTCWILEGVSPSRADYCVATNSPETMGQLGAGRGKFLESGPGSDITR